MMATLTLEPLMILVAYAVLSAYHLHLVHQTRKHLESTSHGITGKLRRAWVKMIMSEKRDILAVQTLRNWIMA